MPDGLTLNKIIAQKGISIGEAARRVADLGWTPTYVQEAMTFPTDYKILARPAATTKDGQGNRIWSLRLLKAGTASWRSGAINSDRGCRNGEEPASVRSFARSKGSSASNRLPDFSYAIALQRRHRSRPRQIDFKEMAAPTSEEVNHRTRARSTWPLSVICTGMR